MSLEHLEEKEGNKEGSTQLSEQNLHHHQQFSEGNLQRDQPQQFPEQQFQQHQQFSEQNLHHQQFSEQNLRQPNQQLTQNQQFSEGNLQQQLLEQFPKLNLQQQHQQLSNQNLQQQNQQFSDQNLQQQNKQQLTQQYQHQQHEQYQHFSEQNLQQQQQQLTQIQLHQQQNPQFSEQKLQQQFLEQQEFFYKLRNLLGKQQETLQVLEKKLQPQHLQQPSQQQHFFEKQYELLQLFKQQQDVYAAYAYKIQDPNYLPVNDLKITHENINSTKYYDKIPEELKSYCEELENKNKVLLRNLEEIQNKSKPKSNDYHYGFADWFSFNQQELKSKNKELKSKLKNLQIEYKNFEAILDTRDNYINGLEKANEDLKKETTRYQSALGDATSFHLGSQDSNSAVQLSEDIRALHSNLEKFCGLKRGVDLKEPEVKELLEKFGCSFTGKLRNNKPLISGLLERLVIETVIEMANKYFDNQTNDIDIKKVEDNASQQQNLEMNIINVTEQLLKLTDSISTNRAGDETVSKATSTKIRQQIYAILGNRGFSNIISDKGDKEHPLIVNLRKAIIDLMNRYRTIKNKDKLTENEKLIDEIVRHVVRIFLFRLKVQVPIAGWKFFEKHTEINTIMMEASWDEVELEDLYVDACAFPIIGSNLCEAERVDENLKVIFPAQIITGITNKNR
ncbi:8384_t:CDS:2 [Funneliformis geosporum]|uniref:2766_t:CDS:1 n=1 Tax=Funneliformis geosporum TaxID=1117311 RepID=A0A9W4WNV0_9GLOM|nr:8384_t:CDS:2 [Funneliformis geosporum]CAI2167709.1 2766_t:CDS:2 [Funneliformis geosporum]